MVDHRSVRLQHFAAHCRDCHGGRTGGRAGPFTLAHGFRRFGARLPAKYRENLAAAREGIRAPQACRLAGPGVVRFIPVTVGATVCRSRSDGRFPRQLHRCILRRAYRVLFDLCRRGEGASEGILYRDDKRRIRCPARSRSRCRSCCSRGWSLLVRIDWAKHLRPANMRPSETIDAGAHQKSIAMPFFTQSP